MYTSVALFFAFVLAEQAPEPALQWLTDYTQARKLGQRDGRPLAVFVGSGERGLSKVSRDGALNAKVRDLLARNYVCVYLDTSRPAAQRLANELEITRGRGLVISDRGGQLQAFHHDGDLSDAELARNLERFAGPNVTVRITESNAHVSYYPPQPSRAPVYAPRFIGGGRGC